MFTQSPRLYWDSRYDPSLIEPDEYDQGFHASEWDRQTREDVGCGARVLDLARPGWFMEIDPGRLDMHTAGILELLYSGIIRGAQALRKAHFDTEHYAEHGPMVFVRDYGYDLQHGWDDGYETEERAHRFLTQVWREEIELRRRNS